MLRVLSALKLLLVYLELYFDYKKYLYQCVFQLLVKLRFAHQLAFLNLVLLVYQKVTHKQRSILEKQNLGFKIKNLFDDDQSQQNLFFQINLCILKILLKVGL